MAIKNRIFTSGKATPKRENTDVTRTSALAETAGQLYGLVKKTEPATKRAIEILEPYQRSLRSPSAKLIAIKKGFIQQVV